MQLNFNALPEADEVRTSDIGKGTHKLTILDAQVIKFNNGTRGLQLTHSINDTNFKLNYDNYAIETGYGQAKLKKLLTAINVIPQGDFDITILPTLIKNKSFIVDLDYGKNKDGTTSPYLSIMDINSFKPLNDSTPSQENVTATPFDESNF